MATMSTMDLLGQMAQTQKATKPKSGKPVLNDESLNEQIDAYIRHTQTANSAKTLADAAKDQIVQHAAPFRLQACADAGKVVASIGINGRLTFTQQCRYSVVPEERADDLRETFGESFDRYFAATLKIGLNEASANNEAVLTELLNKVGPEFFKQHFVVRRDLTVKEAFHQAISCDAAVREKAQPFLDDQTIKPYQAALKIS